MDNFKMELTWHNCATCPPKEVYNPCLVITNGHHIDYCSYYKRFGFPIVDKDLHKYWWADIARTVQEGSKFKENSV